MTQSEFRLLAIIAILANEHVRIDYQEKKYSIKELLDFVSDLSTNPRVINLLKRAEREKET